MASRSKNWKTPNRALNRTLHSVPAFVPAKTLAQIPSRCSGPVSFYVRPRRNFGHFKGQQPRPRQLTPQRVANARLRRFQIIARLEKLQTMIGIWQVQQNMLSDCASRSLNSQLVAAPQSGAYSIRSNRGASENLHLSFALFGVQTNLAPARPNQPINRTYCGRRRLGFRFTLAQTPPAAIGRLSATLVPT